MSTPFPNRTMRYHLASTDPYLPIARLASLSLTLLLLACTTSIGACARSGALGAGQSSAEAAGPPEAYGYVLSASDSTPVAQARVWTSPPTDDAVTDSTGFWSIKEGIVPGVYTVLSEFAGEQGSVGRVQLKAGVSERVLVLLGSRNTKWPPPIILDKNLPVVPAGPKVIRH